MADAKTSWRLVENPGEAFQLYFSGRHPTQWCRLGVADRRILICRASCVQRTNQQAKAGNIPPTRAKSPGSPPALFAPGGPLNCAHGLRPRMEGPNCDVRYLRCLDRGKS